MSKATQIQDCITNHEQYVLTLAAMPDKKLAAKLDTIHLQMEIALQKKDAATLELLEIWRAQTIEARTYKAENNIADAPNEIELAIANIETYVTETEIRHEVLSEYSNPVQKKQPKAKTEEDNNKQLSFF
ncbi:MAG: hypothetical protein JWO06_3462 [Bacteroidota bacterium]|nr:hypothetical protein [Bacteroidota bacterium]